MPYINLKTNLRNFEEKKNEMLKLVVLATKDILGKDEKVTSVLIEKLPFKSWHINSINSTTFFLEIKITKGSNTEEEKAEFIKIVYDGLKAIEPNISFASYILIDEINGDSWGYDGISQKNRYSEKS